MTFHSFIEGMIIYLVIISKIGPNTCPESNSYCIYVNKFDERWHPNDMVIV